jgi:hypothetical protein
MPKYKYLVTAEVEVEAFNVMMAEKAIRSKGIAEVRVVGTCYRTVKMPSQRWGFNYARITVGETKIKRMKNED